MIYCVNELTGEVISQQEMIAANPDTIFPIPFEPVDGFALLDEVEPSFDSATQRLEYSAAASLVDGKWTRAIAVVDLTPAELAAIKKASVPHVVTRRQARRALALAGLLDAVEAAVAAIPDPMQRTIAQIDWADATEFKRDDETLNMLAGALGLSETQLDDLFILAGEQP